MNQDHLSKQHRQCLEFESSIGLDVIAGRGYWTAKTKAELRRLGFSDAQTRVPALVLPVWSVSGEIKLYQARPDVPRISKGKAIKYETPSGSRMALDVHPHALRMLADPRCPLWITEGVKKGDALMSRGCCAVSLLGVWNWRGTNDQGGQTVLADWEYVVLKGRQVYIVFDSDVMLKREIHMALVRLKGFLESRGASVALVYLPSADGGKKTGVDDYLASGHTMDDLVALATTEVRQSPGDETKEDGRPYRAIDSGLVWMKPTADGAVPMPLTNFSARIVADVEEDDGAEIDRMFEIEASLNGSTSRFKVSASRFTAMSWTTEHLGAQAIVYAGLGTRDHARVAIQVLSDNVASRRVYAHTGWREVDGKWVYLHAGGAIGADGLIEGIEVSLPDTLDCFVLPNPPKGQTLTMAVKASLGFMDVAPAISMTTIFAYIYRTALGDVDHGLHLEGSTGIGKTEIVAIAQSHWGPNLNSRNLPGSWSSTANALEELCFVAKDALVVIDDFAPNGTSADMQRLQGKADRIFRSLGNWSARGRLRQDATLKASRPPRCGVISTGEDVPKGQSLRARISVINFRRGDVDWHLLSSLQRDAGEGNLAQAMSGYIQWLAPRYEALRSEFKFRVSEIRDGQSDRERHKRTSDIEAQLIAAMGYFLDFAQEIGALGVEEEKQLRQRASRAIRELADTQAEHQSDGEPARRFISLVSSAISTGRVHVANLLGRPPDDPSSWGWQQTATSLQVQDENLELWLPQGQLIGWLDGEDLYLEADSAFAEVQRLARQQDEPMAVTLQTLGRRLDELRLLASTERRGKSISLKVRRTIQGQRISVYHIKADTLRAEVVAQHAQSAVDASITPSTAGHLKKNSTDANGEVAQPSIPSSRNTELIGQLGQPEIQEEDNHDPWDGYFDSEVSDETS